MNADGASRRTMGGDAGWPESGVERSELRNSASRDPLMRRLIREARSAIRVKKTTGRSSEGSRPRRHRPAKTFEVPKNSGQSITIDTVRHTDENNRSFLGVA